MPQIIKVFVVRAKPHQIPREDQFLQGVLSIGWPTPLSLEKADWDAVLQELKKEHPDYASPINATQIHNFIHLPKGSIVLTPTLEKKSTKIHLFRTVSSYQHKSEWAKDHIGNPHIIKADCLRSVDRENFPEVVQRALKAARKTVTDFSKYAELILPIAEGGFPPTIRMGSGTEGQEARAEAIQTLRELMKSKDDNVRLQAALALMGKAVE